MALNGNSSITVAVIDAGVDRDHEDMGARVLEGFTIGNATGDGKNANSLDSKYHGMACAGIVAASNVRVKYKDQVLTGKLIVKR